jgi:hypothetical protein
MWDKILFMAEAVQGSATEWHLPKDVKIAQGNVQCLDKLEVRLEERSTCLITCHIQVKQSFSTVESDLEPTMAFGVLEFREFSFIRLKSYHGEMSESSPASAVNATPCSDINKCEGILEGRVRISDVVP